MREYNTSIPNSWEKFGNIKELKEEDFIEACSNSESMSEACSKLGLHFTTFKKYAILYKCFNPNQSLKGGGKVFKNRFSLEDVIILGKYQGYSRIRIKKRLILEGYKDHRCEECNNDKWNDKPIPLELEHIDGNNRNNLLNNLKLLCPNCHAQTSTYRGKNKKKK